MMWIGLALAAVLAGQDAAASAPAEPAKAEAAKPAKKDKPKLVCVEEAQIGSLFKKRICATQEEWDRRRERDQEAMSKQGGNVPSCSGPNC